MNDNNRTKLASGLAKIGLVMRHQAWRDAGESGLTPTQAQVLAGIESSAQGWMSVGDIARSLAVTQPTASDAIASLERKGFLARERSTTDARVVCVSLTQQGRRLARDNADWPDVLLCAIGELDEHEQGVFVMGLMKMIRSLQESGQIPTARMCASCTHFRPNVHVGSDHPHHCAYIDAPMRQVDLRLDCGDHEPVSPEHAPQLWELLVSGRPLEKGGGTGTPYSTTVE